MVHRKARVRQSPEDAAFKSLLLLVGAALLTFQGPGLSAQQHDAAVTFTQDVAPILQENCAECHRAGGIAPMPLRTYEQVRRRAPLIRERVQSREMPPWPIDMTVGITRFKNDRSLSDEEIETIVAWVDAGAPMGDLADMPPAIEWPDHSEFWRFEEYYGRPPDIVIASPPYTVPDDGADHWLNAESPVPGLTEQRWIQAAEYRPQKVEMEEVFHHANPSIGNPNEPGGMNSSIRQVRGMEGIVFADNSGVPVDPGDVVRWNMHLFPVNGEVEDAVLELGLWLYPPDDPPAKLVPNSQDLTCGQWAGHGLEAGRRFGDLAGVSADPQIARQGDILIPPHSVVTLRGVWMLDRPVKLQSLRAHMHLRGVYQILEAIYPYPDGRWEVINKMHNNHRWQTEFLYEEDAMPLFPRGTILISTCVYDNTEANPLNPDPTVWVTRGNRTVDEMGHFRAQMTFFDSDEEFQQAVEERRRRLAGADVASSRR